LLAGRAGRGLGHPALAIIILFIILLFIINIIRSAPCVLTVELK